MTEPDTPQNTDSCRLSAIFLWESLPASWNYGNNVAGIRWRGACEKGAMPLFKYFLTVGTVLIAALLFTSSYFESKTPAAAARVSVNPTTASLYIPPPPPKSVQPAAAAAATAALDMAPPQRLKPAKTSRH